VPTTITVDGAALYDLRIVQNSGGPYTVYAVYGLLSGAQVITTINQDVTATLSASELATVTFAFTTVLAAIAGAPLVPQTPAPTPSAIGTPAPPATATATTTPVPTQFPAASATPTR